MRRCASIALFALLLVVPLVGCESSTSLFDLGLDQQLRVGGGQLVKGGLTDCDPAASTCGPAVTEIRRNQASVKRGDGTVTVEGRVGAGATALHVWAEGDSNHWIAPLGPFDTLQPNELIYAVELQFSYTIPGDVDVLDVHLQAADDRGRFGPVNIAEYTILPDVPPAALLVSLAWDAPADLDLYVQLPDKTIVGPKNVNSTVPGSNPADPSWMYGGYLDLDSNQECLIDAVNRENFVWLKHEGDPKDVPPPSGDYKVFANLFSPCGASSVSFEATAILDGTKLESAASTLYAFDARVLPPAGGAPGLLLMEFHVP